MEKEAPFPSGRLCVKEKDMEEREVLRGRIRDLWNRTQQGDYLNHTGFLALDLQSYAMQVIREERIPTHNSAGAYCVFRGGYEEADRKVLLFVPSYMGEEELDAGIAQGEGAFTCVRIAAVKAGFAAPPTHRDYLGSLMHLGITREQIGDIICRDEEAFVFVLQDIAPFVCRELTRVRHTTVTTAVTAPGECPSVVNTRLESGSSASERADSLTALVFHLSRSQAQRLIEQEKVFADGRIITSGSYTPSPGERISVRGYGKFRYLGTDGTTRKGRLIVRFERYI
jgi:RNA-binding protein YlmH